MQMMEEHTGEKHCLQLKVKEMYVTEENTNMDIWNKLMGKIMQVTSVWYASQPGKGAPAPVITKVS